MLIIGEEASDGEEGVHLELTEAGRRKFGEIVHLGMGRFETAFIPEPMPERLPLRGRLEEMGAAAIQRFIRESPT